MAYIDPITGAYVADSLDALPPGYNQPKAGNEANVAKMRAALNNSWENDTPIPDLTPPKTDPFSLVKKAYEHMPGAGVAQGIMPSVLGMPQFLASLGYGLGNQVINPQTANFDKDTTNAMRAMQYTPPTQAGKDISNFLGKVGEATGPLPELWNTRMRFTPDDLRVAGKTATEDFRNFGSDYANAKAGVQREYPTAGSRAAQFTDVAGDLSRPLAEKAYDMYMNPESSVEVYGMRPGANLSGLATAGGPMYAVKPGGGNWPTNLGSTSRLSRQGDIGMHLADTQISDPAVKWWENLPRDIRWKWDDYINQRTAEHGNLTPQQKQAYAEEFTNQINAVREPQGQTPITLPSQFEAIAPQYNSWVMGPYQKYINNQMGTGVDTDSVLQAFNETDLPIEDIFGVSENKLKHDKNWGESRREDYLRAFGRTNEGVPNIDLSLPKNANIGKQTATSPLGIAVENASDSALFPHNPWSFSSSDKEQYPFLDKLPRNAVVNDFINSDVSETTALPMINKKVLNDLLSGNVDISKLSNLTPGSIARQIIKDKIAEKESVANVQKAKDTWRKSRFDAIQSAVPYADGSKMHIITKKDADANENLVFRDLGQNTIDLNQCIGAGCHNTADYPNGHGPFIEPHTGKPPKGADKYEDAHVKRYMDRLKNGESEIARLLDPNGVAQASVELRVRDPQTVKGSEDAHREFIKDWLQQNDNNTYTNILDFGFAGSGNTKQSLFQKHPDLEKAFDAYFRPVAEKRIQEMKGKNNGKIASEYLPQMIEWLNSMGDQLTEVRDLDKLPGVNDLTRSFDAVGNMVDENQHWYSPTVEQFFNKVEDEHLLPRFFTTDDFALKATEMGVDLSAEQMNDANKYPRDASNYMKDMIDYFEPGAIRKSYGGYDRILGFDPKKGLVKAQGVKKDADGNWVDKPGDIRFHSTRPDPEEFKKAMGRPFRRDDDELVDAIAGMEPEAPQQFDRPTEFQRGIVGQNIEDYLQGHFANIENVIADMEEPYATDMRILVGSQRPEARLRQTVHEPIVNLLLDQDNHTAEIRNLMNRLEQGNHFLTEPQAENILNMLISWTERYPLNE
jgi:hypothetical protein